MAANARGEWLSMPAAQWDRIRDGVSPVRVIREYRGLTQTRLARESGVDQSQISAIENSRRTGTAATLKAIAKALGAPLEVLIADDPPVSPDATRRP
jgi:mRNA interferase RelE/StbE